MAKLYFRYGTVGSAKTLNLLAVAHAYKLQEKRVLVLKPAMDTRFGAWTVQSRAGLDREADILLDADTKFLPGTFDNVDCVLVDEVQFVAPNVIEQLRHVASAEGVPVICYGLRTDFRSKLFPGSQRMMELADAIEEVKTTCTFCNRKATLNLKSVDGKPTLDGPTVCLGCEEMYVPACYGHFVAKVAGVDSIDKKLEIDFDAAKRAGDLADAIQAKEASNTSTPTKVSTTQEPDMEASPAATDSDSECGLLDVSVPPSGGCAPVLPTDEHMEQMEPPCGKIAGFARQSVSENDQTKSVRPPAPIDTDEPRITKACAFATRSTPSSTKSVASAVMPTPVVTPAGMGYITPLAGLKFRSGMSFNEFELEGIPDAFGVYDARLPKAAPKKVAPTPALTGLRKRLSLMHDEIDCRF